MIYTKDNFPRCKLTRDGIQIINGKVEQISCMTYCNILYREANGYKNHMHIILPTQNKQETDRFQLIVFVQGSAWHEQTLGRELIQLGRMAAKGYVIAIIQYRPSNVAHFPAQIIDVKYAIDYLMNHKNEYFINDEPYVLWGTSSGGHTALMTGITIGIKDFTSYEILEYKPRCIIDYFGPTDVYEMRNQPSTGAHDTPNCPEALWIGETVTRENSDPTVIMNYIEKNKEIPPILICHGDMDMSVPFEQSVLLYDKLKECNKEVEFFKIYNAEHNGPEFWNDEILSRVDAFIKS